MTTEPETTTSTEPEPPTRLPFEIKNMDDFYRVLTIASGGDPDAIQAITNFMDLRSNIERSYFPDKITTLCIGQLTGFGETYFPYDEWDPFNLIANSLAIAFMPYKGFKSNQFVDMTRQTPNLDALTTTSEDTRQGFLARILGRGKSE